MSIVADGSEDVEMQLAEVQRKFRVMEGSRRSYSEDSQATIRRQRSAIEQLKAENAKLKEQIQLESKAGLKTPSLSMQNEITKLHDLADTYTRKIELEKRRLAELDQAEALAAAKHLEQRKSNGGINAGREHQMQVQRQVKVLENRLEKALVKFNEALAHNKKLREEIDNLKRERNVFDQIYKKLEKELQQKKSEMAQVIELSNIAYDARDQAQNEMAALKAQADKEQAVFEDEMRTLDGELKTEKERHLAETLGQYGPEEESKLRRKLANRSWIVAKDKAGAMNLSNTMRNYEDAFDRIQAATGISDIDMLVSTFIEIEGQNFSTFNYTNETIQEQEKLQDQISEIKAETERLRGQTATGDNHYKRVISDHEAKIEKVGKRTETYEKKHKEALKNINSLKGTVLDMYNKLGCNTESAREFVGEGSITDENIIKYIAVVEQRAKEIVQIAVAANPNNSAVWSMEGGEVGGGGLLGPQTPAGSTQIGIEPPTTAEEDKSDEESDEEVDDRPLTRDELQARTMKSISKKEARTGKGGRVKRK